MVVRSSQMDDASTRPARDYHPGRRVSGTLAKVRCGVVISASHNPWTDNGIKIFSGDGYKLPDAHELAIEKEIFALLRDSDAVPPDAAPEISSVPGEEGLRQSYVHWLASSVSTDLTGLRVAVDCANGAAAAAAPELFGSLKVDATYLHSAPDGQNINENCGALHPEMLARFVQRERGQAGRFRYWRDL